MAVVCLNMIVRNEADKIERALKSIAPWIDQYAILDTGSTDGTIEIIEKFFTDRDIPGRVSRGEFINFEQARNEALFIAQRTESDYILLMDADMELRVNNPQFNERLTAHAYNIQQRSASLSYYNTRFVKTDLPALYRGVTHEYLDVGNEAEVFDDVYFIDHADGTNRKDKFERDIKLLAHALKKEPGNGRYWYYLGQSYRDNGDFHAAADAYQQRVKLGGWAEETWSAMCNYAACLNNTGDEDGFVAGTLDAYNFRPTRAEALYDLARHFRLKGEQIKSLVFSKRALNIPRPNDQLFVNDYVYKTGVKQEYAICAFYDPSERDSGFTVCDELSRDPEGTDASREEARSNLFWYMGTIKDAAPTWNTQQLDFVPPDGYVAMNPSVTMFRGQLVCNVRCVNYTIDSAGRYLIRNTETGEITNDNPIHTRNFITKLGLGHNVISQNEIVAHNMPEPEWALVIGFEDVRLFVYNDMLFGSACVREMNAEGYCEQILLSLNHGNGTVDHWQKMPVEPREHQKNWMPIPDKNIEFGYRIGKIIEHCGTTVLNNSRPSLAHLSGGTQYVPFKGGWLGLVHEARINPQTQTRVYSHRFVWLDNKKLPKKLSRPFVFHEKEIEFAAGIATQGDWVVVSYGRRDCEAWIGSLRTADVERMLRV